jgi:hypothetical protein
VSDHDVFDAKAGDLWGMPHLIGVHCLLKFIDANKYIPFAFMWGWGGSVRKYVKCFLFGGAYALLLTAHVSLLRFFRLGEIACNIHDIDQGPRVVVAPLDRFEPRLFHQNPIAACRYLIIGSMLGNSYTLWMYSQSMICNMMAMMCSRVVLVDSTS